MKKGIAIAVSAVLAVVVAVFCIICLTRIKVGYVGVVYSAKGVEQNTLTQGWHWLSPLKVNNVMMEPGAPLVMTLI